AEAAKGGRRNMEVRLSGDSGIVWVGGGDIAAPCGFTTYRCLIEEEVAENEIVHVGSQETAVGVLGSADGRFAADVEGSVDEDRTAGPALERAEQIVEARVSRGGNRLDARRVIDMSNSGQGRAPLLQTRHKIGRAFFWRFP